MTFCPSSADWGDIASWASIFATLATIVGAFFLWQHQQRTKQEQMREVGIAMFEQLYQELLELEAYADYNRFSAFNKQLMPKVFIGVDVHKKAIENMLDQLSFNTAFAIENLSVLRQGLGDIESQQKSAMLRLMYFVGGLPKVLERIKAHWEAQPLDSKSPCALTPDDAFALRYGTEAAAYYLGKLGRPQKRSTQVFEEVLLVREKIWNGVL